MNCPIRKFSQLDRASRKLMRAIIRKCVRAPGGICERTGMSEREAVDSTIELIEAGLAHVETWEDSKRGTGYRIALNSGAAP